MSDFPWAESTPDPTRDLSPSQMMVGRLPEAAVNKYKVIAANGIKLFEMRDAMSFACGGGLPSIPAGTVLSGDLEQWCNSLPSLRVRLYTPNVLFGHGFVMGWADSADLQPLTEAAAEIAQPASIDFGKRSRGIDRPSSARWRLGSA